MKALVITGGEAPDRTMLDPYLEEVSYVVAADSGLESARSLGLRPDRIVGDFDSLCDAAVLDEYDRSVVEPFPAAKDDTDTEIALQAAWEAGAGQIVLAGGGGGRMDHLLALVALFDRERYPGVWITASEIVQPVDDELVVSGTPGDLVSFFALGPGVCRMRSRGLRWPLDSLRWTRGDAGVSNEFVEREVRVEMLSGRLLMVRSGERA